MITRHIPVALARLVRERAGDVCEYCLLPQSSQEATFHVDHILPRAIQGAGSAENLALACVTCSLKKAARTHARDPQSNQVVPLFHPRRDVWSDHFRMVWWLVLGWSNTYWPCNHSCSGHESPRHSYDSQASCTVGAISPAHRMEMSKQKTARVPGSVQLPGRQQGGGCAIKVSAGPQAFARFSSTSV